MASKAPPTTCPQNLAGVVCKDARLPGRNLLSSCDRQMMRMDYATISNLLNDERRQIAGGADLTEWASALMSACMNSEEYFALGGVIVPQFGRDEGRPLMFEAKSLSGWEPATDETLENLWRTKRNPSCEPFQNETSKQFVFQPISHGFIVPIGYTYAVCDKDCAEVQAKALRLGTDLLALSLIRHKLTNVFHNLTLAPAQPDISLSDYAKSVASHCRAALGVNAVIVWELPANDTTLRTVATAFDPATAKKHHLPETQPQFQIAITIGKGFIGRAAETKEEITISDATDESLIKAMMLPPPEQPGLLRQFEWRSILITPLVLREKTIGVIASYGVRPGAFGELDQMIHRAFSERLTSAFANIYRISELTELEQRLQKEAPAIEAGWEAISVAHDLRDDLWVASSGLRAAIDLAKTYPVMRKPLETAARNVKAAHDKTSLLTRSSANKQPYFSITDVHQLLQRCRKDLTLFTNPEDITVTVQCAETVDAEIDDELMRRALNNVLSNALYFLKGMTHRPNKAIKLSATATDETVTIVCEDNGPGIAEENLSEIFKFYYTTKGDKGLGFGLAITKNIVENIHDGQLSVASQWGQWTKFRITVPHKRR